MRRLALIAVLGLAACQTAPHQEPKVVVQRVEVPVAVKCSTDPGPDPVYSDSAEALRSAPNIYERVKLLLAGRFERMAREAELKAANSGCR